MQPDECGDCQRIDEDEDSTDEPDELGYQVAHEQNYFVLFLRHKQIKKTCLY